MAADDPRDPGPESPVVPRAEISGTVSDVVQARDVRGGVHFHGPPAGPAEPVPRQLPANTGAFVNRRDELAWLNDTLSGEPDRPAGVYVISGTAGVGKTSLALHWAHGIQDRFPDGQLYVNLRGYDPDPPVSPEHALNRFLRALGVPVGGIPPELEDKAALYRSLLAGRRVLVVLDNAATVGQVRPLLPGTAGCLVVVTSRSQLSGLVARDGARRLSLDVLTLNEAVRLVQTVTAGYRTRDEQAQLVELARLCARLPLALRIAAERASSRPLMLLNDLIADLLDQAGLWHALTVEDGEEADAVRSVFAWSYRALPEPAARLFRLLGLHPGPEFGTSAAAAVAGVGVAQARQLLDALVGAHMLEQRARERYQFHDLLRAYAADQAVCHEMPEGRQEALRRVLAWYLHSAVHAVALIAPLDRPIVSSPPADADAVASFASYDEALGWFETEQANLVSAIRAAAAAGFHEIAWQLPAVLWSVYSVLRHFDDWITTTRIGLQSAQRIENLFGEAELLASLGMAHLRSNRLVQAEELHRAALALRREIGDTVGIGMSSTCLGLVAWRRHRLAEALRHFEETIQHQRATDDRPGQAWTLSNIGMIYFELERLPEAVTVLRQSVALGREVGDLLAEGNALCFLAGALRESGALDEALVAVQAALAIAREHGSAAGEGFCLLELARVQRGIGRAADALASYQRCATIHRQLRDRSREAMALDGIGETYQEMGVPDEAARFHRLAVSAYRDLDAPWPLAIALTNLATALRATGGRDRARPHLAEAASLLAQFDDPRAVRRRRALSALLDG